MSYLCRLCGLTIEAIPDDAIQCGKLYRFSTGEYHDLRKKLAPRAGPRPRKSKTNPDREAPQPTGTTPSTPRGTHAHQVPEHEPVEPSIQPAVKTT
jgi:hypothetical protein